MGSMIHLSLQGCLSSNQCIRFVLGMSSGFWTLPIWINLELPVFARSKMRRTCIFASWNVALEWWPRCSHGKLLKCSGWVSDDDDGGDDVIVLGIIIMMKMMKLRMMKMMKWNTNIMMIRRKNKTLQFGLHWHVLLDAFGTCIFLTLPLFYLHLLILAMAEVFN